MAELLPTDGQVNLSAFVWEHLGPTVGPLASKLSATLAAEELKALETVANEGRPFLVTAYAEDELIVISSRGEPGLGSLLGSIMSANPLGSLGTVLEHARRAGDSTKK